MCILLPPARMTDVIPARLLCLRSPVETNGSDENVAPLSAIFIRYEIHVGNKRAYDSSLRREGYCSCRDDCASRPAHRHTAENHRERRLYIGASGIWPSQRKKHVGSSQRPSERVRHVPLPARIRARSST